MRQRNDTLGMMSNPLVGQMFDPAAMDMNEEVMMEREAQKEHELRILGTMLFQAFFLSMCILLYERWEWSQFNNTAGLEPCLLLHTHYAYTCMYGILGALRPP